MEPYFSMKLSFYCVYFNNQTLFFIQFFLLLSNVCLVSVTVSPPQTVSDYNDETRDSEGCEDSFGHKYAVGQTWSEPGCDKRCTVLGVVIDHEQCPERQANEICTDSNKPDVCCPICTQIKESSDECIYHLTGIKYESGESWMSREIPCSRCSCSRGNVICDTPDCPSPCAPGQKPNHQQCCTSNCSGLAVHKAQKYPCSVDDPILGKVQKLHGSTWFEPGQCTDRKCQCIEGKTHCFPYCDLSGKTGGCSKNNTHSPSRFCCPRCLGKTKCGDTKPGDKTAESGYHCTCLDGMERCPEDEVNYCFDKFANRHFSHGLSWSYKDMPCVAYTCHTNDTMTAVQKPCHQKYTGEVCSFERHILDPKTCCQIGCTPERKNDKTTPSEIPTHNLDNIKSGRNKIVVIALTLCTFLLIIPIVVGIVWHFRYKRWCRGVHNKDEDPPLCMSAAHSGEPLLNISKENNVYVI